MDSLIRIALSAWSLVWAFSFWGKTEKLRERLGIWFEYPAPKEGAAFATSDEPLNRWDEGGLGAWVNCPQCMAFLAVLPVSASGLLRRTTGGRALPAAATGLAAAALLWCIGADAHLGGRTARKALAGYLSQGAAAPVRPESQRRFS